ncbi:hypothetical protein LTR05_004061 [Lithohypha guttulata]|uniref:Uncharacterized protein n=1 Tax=Lithohypha guttulata TaxID=1690604 RepID=A0AAN7T0Z1_9EURO|nr:hypothetical protein LTR05_004061 [Lithohypha guttulata]
MAWIESSPGIWGRPLALTEIGMIAPLASLLPSNPAYPATQVVSALRSAWKALRLLRSPDIATTFKDGQKIYSVTNSEDLEKWLEDTFTLKDITTSLKDAVRDEQLKATLLPTLALLPETATESNFIGSVILFISHWRTEAAGVFKMLDQIFDYAEDLLTGSSTAAALETHVLGSEANLLTPALDDIFMSGKRPSDEAKACVTQDFSNYYANFPPLDYPMQREPTASPSYLKVNQRTYTVSSTSTLVASCKANNVTITAAVHAAYLGAVWQLASPESEKRSYASIMPAQLRTRLPKSSPYREQGCWDSARMLLLTAPPDQDFLTRAQNLKTQYARANTDEWLYDDIGQIPIQMGLPPASDYPLPISMPYFTSIGVLDNEVIVPDHGGFQVNYLTFWADSTMPGIVLRLWTFKKRLNVQIQWNAAYHSDASIQRTLDIIEEILKQELGMTVDVERSSVEEYNG